MKAIRQALLQMYRTAIRVNQENILALVEHNPRAVLIDLGCDNGTVTEMLATRQGGGELHGVDVVDERMQDAVKRGIHVYKFDLNSQFELKSETFDVVHANQVIEHISNSDGFLGEVYRILKPGGYAIISTENASSWCNIAASIVGLQMFSLTNFSSKRTAIGNPFSLHDPAGSRFESWNHVRVYNILGLRDYFRVFGFTVEAIKGAGYFPLPAVLGRLDTIHSHFITYKVRKPLAA